MFKILGLVFLFLYVIKSFQIKLTNLSNRNNNILLMTRTLLETENLPKFTKFDNKEIEPDITLILENLEKDFSELENKITNEENLDKLYNLVVEESERIEYPLSFGWGLVSHLNSVKNNDDLRKAYEKMQPEVIKLSTKISQSKVLYDGLDRLKESDNLNKIQRRIVELSVKGMFLNGIGLEGEQKDKFNEIKLKLAELSTKFANNVLDSTKKFELYITTDEDMLKLPMSVLELFSQQAKDKYSESTAENGPWKITLDMPSYLPIMQHHPSSKLREQLYRAFITRASEGEYNNIPIIDEILNKKKELATLLGFNNYAELSLSKKMADNVEQIENLLNMLANKARPYAIKDLELIKDFANKNRQECEELNLWDYPYWVERYKEQELQFKEEDLKPYLPLESVLKGLFQLAENLFDINIQEVDLSEGELEVEVWDESVKFFRIFNKTSYEPIAAFFLDPFSRPGEKKGGAWMNSCVDRNKYLGKSPVAYLICNGSPPIKNDDGSIKKPSLMTFREVETLFHEFGHGLQHMLTNVEEGGASGINNIEWDAVELPSQFMENWCYHKPTVMGFAKHYETGEELPDELFNKIVEQKTFMTGGGMLRQIYFSMLDLYLYSKLKEGEDIMEVQRRFGNEYSVRPILEEDRFLCSFSHIFAGGYSAGYYSYKWAEIMSSDAFGAFEEIDLNNKEEVKEIGMKFRETVLGRGGSEHPSKVYRDFRGRDPNPDALLRHNGLN
jgi:oligopeptidase A